MLRIGLFPRSGRLSIDLQDDRVILLIFETHVIVLNNRNGIDYISPAALPLRDTFNAEFSYSKLLSSHVRVVPILVWNKIGLSSIMTISSRIV